MKIKLSDIHVENRVREDMGDIKGMARDLQENGQITAITVRPRNAAEIEAGVSKPWVLIAGGRRMAAAMLLGWDEVNAMAREEMAELKHRILELRENLGRKEMTWDEEAKAKEEILRLRRLENPEITQGEVAQEIGETGANFSRSIKAAKILESNPELVKAGSVKALLRVDELSRSTRGQTAVNLAAQRSLPTEELERRVESGDMRGWLQKREDGSVDLFLVDYPYGVNYWKAGHKLKKGDLAKKKGKSAGLSEYDDSPENAILLMTDTIPEILRVTRLTGWVAFFGNYDSTIWMNELIRDCCVTHYKYKDESGKCPMHSKDSKCEFLSPEIPWVWYRPNSANNPRYPERHAKVMQEYIVMVNRGHGRFQTMVENVLEFDAYYGSDRIHANQKPIELYQEIIERCAGSGAVVADPCFGSGSSLAAAASKGCYIYGCELNADIVPAARGLIQKHAVPIDLSKEGLAAERSERLLAKPVPKAVIEDTSEIDTTQRYVDRDLDDSYFYAESVAQGFAHVRTEYEVKKTFEGRNAMDDAESYAMEMNFPEEDDDESDD